MPARCLLRSLAACILCPIFATALHAGDKPYFVTYDHQMEEPGNLEIATNPTLGKPQAGNRFLSLSTEFEYGLKGWWTTEFYLNSQTTRHDSTLFTGFRWENRIRLLMREHRINPVLYVELSNINGADKTLKEVVGHDSQDDLADPNHLARREKKREMETKLILSSNVKGWNIAENFIAEKNLKNEPWEFGYAVGLSRPLGLAASPSPCNFCWENFRAGVEFYGGLGTRYDFGLANTSHYVAPILAWQLNRGVTLRISPGFGLTPESHRVLMRFGVSYEIPAFRRQLQQVFR